MTLKKKIESSHSKLNSCKIKAGRPPLPAGVPREQGLFILFCRSGLRSRPTLPPKLLSCLPDALKQNVTDGETA